MFKKLKRYVIILLILTASAGCPTNISGDFYLIYEPIYTDYENDTSEIIRQIDRNNIVYDEIFIKLIKLLLIFLLIF